MLEVIEDDIPNVQSRRYRIPENYFKVGLTEYLIKDTGIIGIRNKIFFEQLNDALQNPICNNLVKIYPKLEIPTSEELLIIGKQLVKENRTTKKGKTGKTKVNFSTLNSLYTVGFAAYSIKNEENVMKMYGTALLKDWL